VRRSRVVAPVIVTAACIAMAGCSSGGGLDAHQSGHSTASAAPHPGSSAAAIPTGVQLGKVLNGTHLPAGWKLPPGSGDLSNSGPTNMSQNGPPPHEYACKYVGGGAQAGYIVSWWSSSNASMILEYPAIPGNLPQVNLGIAAYAPGAAAKNMAKAAELIARCRSFRVPGLPGHDTTSVKTIPHLGTQNLFLTAKDHLSSGSITDQMLLVRDGNYIVSVDTNTGTDGNVRPATVQGFGGWLLQQLRQAKYLS
jgi:hypothetical protein